MAKIIKEISVDLAQTNRFAAIVAKQYDKTSRYLKVTLLNEEEEFSVDANATVTINARREDETAKSFAGEVNSDGTVTVPLTYWMLELDGTVKCDISIINGTDNVLTTTLFELEVEEAAADDTSVSNDEDYGILVSLIEEVKETSETLTKTYESSAKSLQESYESSLDEALEKVDTAVTAAQLVTSPFYIVDNDTGTTYTAAIQVTDGKPIMVYEEFTGE